MDKFRDIQIIYHIPANTENCSNIASILRYYSNIASILQHYRNIIAIFYVYWN